MTNISMIKLWPWLVTWAAPLLLAAAWLSSLIAIGDTAQALPYALLATVLFGVICYQIVLLNRTALAIFMAFAVLMINVTFRHRTPGEPGLDWQNGYKICFWMVFLLVFAINIRHILRYYRDPVLLLFGGFCLTNLFSTIYSPVPLVSLAGALGTLAYFGFAIIVVETLGVRRTLIAILAVCVFYSVLNLFSPIYAPQAAWFLTDPSTQIFRFEGISGQPNSLSRQSVIFLIVILIAYQRGVVSRPAAAGMAVLALSLAIATEGRSALLAFIAALIMQLRKRYMLTLGIGGLVVLMLLLLTGTADLILASLGRDGNADEALSMAGRTELWGFAWDEVVRHPIMGHGYNSFETFAADHWVGVDRDIVVVTHNSYLEALYSTGIVGEFFFTAPFLILFYRWWTRPDFGRDLTTWALAINALTEVELTTTAILPAFAFFTILAFDAKDQLDGRGS